MSIPAEIWTGQWRWKADTAQFTNPAQKHVWKEQTQEVVVKGDKLSMKTRQVAMDGATRSWSWEGAFDGQPRPITWDQDGSTMATISFILLKDLLGGDVFQSADGAFTGSEHFVISENLLQVWGATTSDGKQYTYFEEWERIG